MSETVAKVAWLESPGELVWREEALPAPGPGEVLCETVVSAISPGTELAAWRGDPPLRPGNPYPRVQGYCNVAKVIETGDGVGGITPGQRVLTLQSHRSHFIADASSIYHGLQDNEDASHTAATYLFHLGYNAVLRSNVRPGHRVLVIGLGALGLTSVAMAALAGADVTAVSSQPSPAAIARTYGARAVLGRDNAGRDPHLSRYDVIILTTNDWGDFEIAQRAAEQNAVIACLGFPGRGKAPGEYNPLAAEHFYNKQLRIEAVGFSPVENDARGFARFNMRDNIAFLAGAIADGRLDPDPILSGRYPAADLAQAYVDLDARKDDAITYLLDWSE